MARNQRPQDAFGAKAKKEGFPARAVYKLEEIDRRVQLLRKGQRVLDLGCFPGSWSLYAAKRVGEEGRVLGVDIQPPTTPLPAQARHEERDVLALNPGDLGGPSSFDLVLSDMAPSTTGTRFVDQCRSFELFMHALSLAEGTLSQHGHFVGKIFQGPDFDEAKKRVQSLFTKTRIIKPEASRRESIEIFLVGLKLKR